MATRTRKPKPSPVSDDMGRGIMLAASLLESLGPLSLGGLHGGMPGSRRAGQDSPAVVTEQQLQFYRGVSRWAYERNEYYGGLIDNALVNYTCGRGYTWKAGQRGLDLPPDAPPPTHIKTAQDTLDDFRHADRWRSRQREEVRRVERDGESFRRLFASLRGGLPLCRFAEPEHITAPPGYTGSEEWRFGVFTLRHDAERPLAYYVKPLADEPGEVVLAAGATWGEIPGDYLVGLERGRGCIVHRKQSRCDRAIKRGLPLFWGGTDGLEQAETLIDNLTGIAAYLSTIAYFRQHAPGVTSTGIVNFQEGIKTLQQSRQGETIPSPTGLPMLAGLSGFLAGFKGLDAYQYGSMPLGPRVVDITNGLAMVPVPDQKNVIGFLAVLQARIRAACVLIGAPEYLGSADASNNNYASIKEAGSPFVIATEARQQDCADGDQVVAEVVLRYAGVDYPGVRVEVTTPEVAMKSDLEKAQVTGQKLRDKTMSPQEAIRQDGRDPVQTMAELKAWDEQFPQTAPMLPMPFDTGTSGNAAQ